MLLLAKPGRTLSSIAKELAIPRSTIYAMSTAGRWSTNLRLHLNNTPEALALQAQLEAQRSRTAQLAANALYETAIDAALVDLLVVGEDGVVRLRPGKDVSDLSKLAQARNTHVKTTQLLTGEADASRRSVAAAGAAKVIIQAGSITPEPLPVAGQVVSPVASPEPIELKPQ